MQRVAVLLVMLFALLWQSVALARPGSTVNLLADPEHAALHWQEAAHQHHDDGSVHLDDSQDAVLHVLGDQVASTAALLPSRTHHGSPGVCARPGGQQDARCPDPFVAGLLRPPRSHA